MAGGNPEARDQSARLGLDVRPLRKTVLAVIGLASVLLLLAAFAVWADRQLLETDTWVETSSNLLEDEEIQSAVSTRLVDALFDNVDVASGIGAALPEEAEGLAGPVSGGVRELATRAAGEVLASAPVQTLWEEANRKTHERLKAVIEGGDERISTEDGAVTLDLGEIATQVGDRVGIDVAGRIPPGAAQIEILRSDEISAAQTGADILSTLVWVLAVLALGLYALAIYLAKSWRREALRATGLAFIGVGVLVLVLRAVAGSVVVGSLASNEAAKPAVGSVWSIGTSALKAIGVSLITYGVVAVIGAWLAGRTSAATETRRSLAPALDERWAAYGVLAVVVILFFLFAPAGGTERLLPSLVLIALLAAGFEILRRQTLSEFPKASWRATSRRLLEQLPGRRGHAEEPSAPGEKRIAGLERLSNLRESGALSEAEFEREKRRHLDDHD